MVTKLKIRRDNSAIWIQINPVLEQGEPAVELDTGKMKIGDGERPYVELPYTSSTSTGDTTTVAWGDITGTIASNGALATALSNKEAKAHKGVANGYAPLNEDAVIPGIYILKGQPNGVPSLDEDGVILSEQLPPINIPDSIPKGVIVMWSGTLATIPAGWALCDGTNGTPNLQNKFILATSSGINPGNTGGADTVTIATANLPSHKHTTAAGPTGLNLSATTTINTASNDSTGLAGKYVPYTTTADTLTSVKLATQSPTTASVKAFLCTQAGYSFGMGLVGSGGTHTHTATTSVSGNGSTDAIGSGQAINILPPYYTLAYIIKL